MLLTLEIPISLVHSLSTDKNSTIVKLTGTLLYTLCHKSEINAFHDKIVLSCITAAAECLVVKNLCLINTLSHGMMPIRYLQETALYWHWLWKSKSVHILVI